MAGGGRNTMKTAVKCRKCVNEKLCSDCVEKKILCSICFDSMSDIVLMREQLEALQRAPFKPRLLHDIVQYDSDSQRDQYLKQLARPTLIKNLIVSDHWDISAPHLHIFHDCTFTSYTCRCTNLQDVPINNRRTAGVPCC